MDRNGHGRPASHAAPTRSNRGARTTNGASDGGHAKEVARWLMARRQAIEEAMNARLGPAAPEPSSPETEALRRFRTYSATALTRGGGPAPNLDGLRVNQRRVTALLEAWTECATLLAGSDGPSIEGALSPLVDEFRMALRTSQGGRKASGKPRTARRAVVSAIDRVPDAFLAIDTDSGQIEDANPAAGALLGVKRDALLGVDALSFVPKPLHAEFWSRLDSISEGNEHSRATLCFRDVDGRELHTDASLTAFATRTRTLALLLLRRQSHDDAPSLQPNGANPGGVPAY